MIDPAFLENFGSGAGGGFLGVLLGWLLNKQQLKELREDIATKASQHEVDSVKEITNGLVRERTCVARTEGLAKTLVEKIDGVNDKLATRIDGVIHRVDEASRRFDRIDDKLNTVHDMLLVPFVDRAKKA